MLMPALPEYPVLGIFNKRRNQEEECVSDNYARYLVNCQKTRDRAFLPFPESWKLYHYPDHYLLSIRDYLISTFLTTLFS